ncbi:hypothetical protein SELMODRAFT_86039, partial [Selaginella moellendorffii]
FQLPEPLSGKTWKLEDFKQSPALLVMFICNHCPYVVHLKEGIAKLAQEYSQKGVAVVGISSNSVATHPEDGPEMMAEDAKKFGYNFPYLYDEAFAKAYGAVCTPEFFLFKKSEEKCFELVYHGRFDESRPRSGKPITGRHGSMLQFPYPVQAIANSLWLIVGCSIKWHPQ